jgi:hypothetical protein
MVANRVDPKTDRVADRVDLFRVGPDGLPDRWGDGTEWKLHPLPKKLRVFKVTDPKSWWEA